MSSGVERKDQEFSADPICRRLLKIRQESGLTDSQIIALSGKSNGWWHGLRQARHAPNYSTLEQVSQRLLLPLRWIETGEGHEPTWAEFRERMRGLANEMKLLQGNGVVREKALPHQEYRVGGAGNVRALAGQLAALLGLPEAEVWKKIAELMAEQAGRGK